jgi:hypothetical protein
MRFSAVAWLAVLAVSQTGFSGAFAPISFGGSSKLHTTSFQYRDTVILQSIPTPDMNDEDHIRQAYVDWCRKYGKSPDPVRYQSFKNNYITITVHNVKTKEEADRAGQPAPEWITLNQYGDYSVAEYEAFMRGEKPETPAPTPAVIATEEVSVVHIKYLEASQQ